MNPKLFTTEFVSLNIVNFFAFCNLSMFYGFYVYLDHIGIPLSWRGILVGLEPMTAFLLRPIISMLLHAGNAIKIMLLSLVMIMIALISYQWANTIASLIILRIFHGAAFVMLVSAGMAVIVNFIPEKRSAEGFGIMSLATLIPYAVMPLLVEFLLRFTKNEAGIYAWVSVLAMPAFFLLAALSGRIRAALEANSESLVKRFSLKEVKENLKNHELLLLLMINLMLFLSYALVFFFIKNLTLYLGIKATGVFFTISTIVIIIVRVLSGKRLDKTDKLRTMKYLMIVLAVLLGLASRIPCAADCHVAAFPLFVIFAVAYGICIGMIFPLLNASVFSASPPRFRGLNTNLSLFMMDAGFFLSPILGGVILSKGFSVPFLFDMAAGSVLLAALALWVRRKV